MSFQKLTFEKIITDGQIKYFINGKEVSEVTYNKLLNDDSLYTLPPPLKVNDNIDEDYEELSNIVQDIRQMSDDEAINGLRNYLEVIKTEIYLQTLIDTYNEIGNNSIKFAARLENKLEDFLNQFLDEE